MGIRQSWQNSPLCPSPLPRDSCEKPPILLPHVLTPGDLNLQMTLELV